MTAENRIPLARQARVAQVSSIATTTQSLQPSKAPQLGRLQLYCRAWLCATALALPATGADTEWRVGGDFRRQLGQPLDVSWENTPLREGLTRLAEAQRIAIFLDRRVDPGQRVAVPGGRHTLESWLRAMAKARGLGVGFVGPVVYVGPPLTCARIATLAESLNEDVRTLPAGAQRRLLQRRDWGWPHLAEPKLILADIAATSGLSVPQLSQIPHDLWTSSQLPPMTFPEQATLLLAGFDLSFTWNSSATQLTLRRFPRAVALERTYRTSDPESFIANVESKYPQAFVERAIESNAVLVRTTLEDHWQLQPSRTPQTTPVSGEQRFTLTVTQKPLDAVLRVLAAKLGRHVHWHEDISEAQKAVLVDVSVREVSADALIEELVRAGGWSVRLEDKRIMIGPEKPISAARNP